MENNENVIIVKIKKYLNLCIGYLIIMFYYNYNCKSSYLVTISSILSLIFSSYLIISNIKNSIYGGWKILFLLTKSS